jgi:hypothetical protein
MVLTANAYWVDASCGDGCCLHCGDLIIAGGKLLLIRVELGLTVKIIDTQKYVCQWCITR